MVDHPDILDFKFRTVRHGIYECVVLCYGYTPKGNYHIRVDGTIKTDDMTIRQNFSVGRIENNPEAGDSVWDVYEAYGFPTLSSLKLTALFRFIHAYIKPLLNDMCTPEAAARAEYIKQLSELETYRKAAEIANARLAGRQKDADLMKTRWQATLPVGDGIKES